MHGKAFKRSLKRSTALYLCDVFVRRGIDVGFVLLAALPAAIVFAYAARAVCKETGRPILYRQTRIGEYGREFTMYKIRSLKNKQDAHGNDVDENLRHTPFGDRMRKCAIDEIPQLWNIFIGEMSLFGPRALPVTYEIAHDPYRQSVRPGVVGLAQVLEKEAGVAPDREMRLRRDKKYIASRTLRMDLRLTKRAIVAVMKGNGDKANAAARREGYACKQPNQTQPAPRELTPTG